MRTKTLSLQWDGATPSEGVKHFRDPAAVGVENRLFHFTVQFGVVPVLPYRHAFHQFMQAATLCILLFGCGEAFRMRYRIIHQLCEQNGSCCGKRASCPIQMQGGWQAMTQRFLTCGFRIDHRQWYAGLDQFTRLGFPGHGHALLLVNIGMVLSHLIPSGFLGAA